MFSKILGTISILSGLFWIIKPEVLKNRLKKKMNRKIKWTIYGFILMFSVILIGNAFKVDGFLMKLIAIIGMVVAIRIIMALTSKTSEKILAWWGDKPLVFFRVWAVFIIIFGLMLVLA